LKKYKGQAYIFIHNNKSSLRGGVFDQTGPKFPVKMIVAQKIHHRLDYHPFASDHSVDVVVPGHARIESRTINLSIIL
jgi:hypothetical protein